MSRLAPLVVPLAFLAIACSSSSTGTPGVDAAVVADAPAALPDAPVIGGSRPVRVNVPPSYTPGTPVPLVIMLHGYSFTGDIEEVYLGLTQFSNDMGFIYAIPEGTKDQAGNPFWNATDACCDLYGSGVDDSTYLSGVITQLEAVYSIDPKRVFIWGHSNGAFMAHRMACDHADQIAAIVSLAGAQWSDLSKCKPSEPVAVLQIHGTADSTIPYDGSTAAGFTFPSAPMTVMDWATLDGCTGAADTSAPAMDLDSVAPGAETTVTSYGDCRPGGAAVLWTMAGVNHIPSKNANFDPAFLGFMFAHPKP
jgi:polyhydroxybutyrate depolymerase